MADAVPLTVGSIVSLNGILKNEELGIRVQGRARVLHCRGNQEGNFHIGLAYEDLAYSRSA